MNSRLILCLALVLGGGFANASDTNLLRVVIIPSRTHVRIKEPFNLALRVENPTRTNQTIRVMNCSWDEEWQSSNTNILLGGWACTKNFAGNVQIPPGGAYTNQSQIGIYNLITSKTLGFRMGFTSIGSTNTYWSNEVKLHILPPDAWVHGGKYYRDRNHDGKIDWEVSGTTWEGHFVAFKTTTNSDGSMVATEEFTGQGVDTYKVDTNHDGFYDLEYGAGGTNGQIQWTKPIQERVPVIGKDFIPVQKETWMDYWMPK